MIFIIGLLLISVSTVALNQLSFSGGGAFGDMLASPGLLSSVGMPVAWGPGVEAGGPCRLLGACTVDVCHR